MVNAFNETQLFFNLFSAFLVFILTMTVVMEIVIFIINW